MQLVFLSYLIARSIHGDVQLVSLNMLCKDRDMSITYRALFLSSEKILSEPSARQDVLTAGAPILEGKVNDIIILPRKSNQAFTE